MQTACTLSAFAHVAGAEAPRPGPIRGRSGGTRVPAAVGRLRGGRAASSGGGNCAPSRV